MHRDEPQHPAAVSDFADAPRGAARAADRVDNPPKKRHGTVFSKAIGRRMAFAMHERSISTRTMAQILRLRESTVRAYLKGHGMPGIYALSRIADECCVSTDWLLGRLDLPDPIWNNTHASSPRAPTGARTAKSAASLSASTDGGSQV